MFKELQVLKDFREPLGLKVQLVLKVQPEHKVLKELKVFRVFLTRVFKELKVHQFRVFKVLLVFKDL